MPQENQQGKEEQKVEKQSKLISNKALFSLLFIATFILVIFVSKSIYHEKTKEYENRIYSKVNKSILDKYDTMLHEKLDTSVLVSSALSKDTIIRKALKKNNSSLLDMDKLLAEMRTTSEYADIEAEVIDKDGISFKRSWTYLAGDDLVKDDPKMAHLIKYPRVYTDIVATKYGLTMTNKIPIYDKDEFLGLFGVNIHFNALVSLIAKDGFKSVILLNKEDSRRIVQDLSYSKLFIDDYYVVNSNADKYLVRIIDQADAGKFVQHWDEEYRIDKQTGYLISKYIIKDANKDNKATTIIFKSLDEIDFEDLPFMQKAHIIATILVLLLMVFLIYFFYMVAQIKEIKKENEKLTVINNELESKTNEMDFNDKKLDNLFNAQPNLMFMHNGKEVTKVNKRFMGFFNRFGTFEGFKKKHKCVSELFEKYEAPNYIWEQYIDGYFWIDYILKYPRRLYKTVMSINGDPHHFIIKLNEMDYAKHVDERLIIVALVDMTQDLVNYKTLEESSQVLKELKDKNLEVEEEKANSDISDDFKISILNGFSTLIPNDVKDIFIDKTDPHGVKARKLIKVDGELNFTNVDIKWLFYISKKDTKILKSLIDDEILNGELEDIAQRFIYTISAYLCDIINKKDLHDLQKGAYRVSSVADVENSELSELPNLYQITIRVDGDKTVEFYTTIDDSVSVFFNKIVTGKHLIDIKQIESKSDEEENTENNIDDNSTDSSNDNSTIDDNTTSTNSDNKEESINANQDKQEIDVKPIEEAKKKVIPKVIQKRLDKVKEKSIVQNDIEQSDETIKTHDAVETKVAEEDTNKNSSDNTTNKAIDKEEKVEQQSIQKDTDVVDKKSENKSFEQEKVEATIKENNIPKNDESKEVKKVEDEPTKSEESAIKPAITPIKRVIQPAVKKQATPIQSVSAKQPSAPTPHKIDPYMILQKSFFEYLSNIITYNVKVSKLSLVKNEALQNVSLVEFDNVFRVLAQNKNLSWKLLIPASSLSYIFNLMIDDLDGKLMQHIDNTLKDIAQEMVNSISKSVKDLTKDQIKLITSSGIIKDKVSFDNQYRILDLGIVIENRHVPIFVVYKVGVK